MTATDVIPGLEGVVSHVTALSEVDGERGRLSLRGYSIEELVGEATFEEAAFLLWHGELPSETELREMQAAVARARHLPPSILEVLAGPAQATDGMHALRIAASACSVDEPAPDDTEVTRNQERALRITARLASLVAAHHRLRTGQQPIVPPDDLGIAAGYLYSLEGEVPSTERIDALNAYMVAVIDHGMNASTFTARVVASTGSDMVSAVTAAIGALKGPLHGGVPGPVLEMLESIGSPDNAEAWIRAAMGRGERIMGFGHRVYKVRDPRAAVLATAAEKLAASSGDRRVLDVTREVERVTVQVLGELKPGRDLYANVELYAALVLHALRLPSEVFTPTFAAARVAGWTAHILEQYADNRLIRPQSVYAGPRDRTWLPASAR
jgi:citrate synthase